MCASAIRSFQLVHRKQRAHVHPGAAGNCLAGCDEQGAMLTLRMQRETATVQQASSVEKYPHKPRTSGPHVHNSCPSHVTCWATSCSTRKQISTRTLAARRNLNYEKSKHYTDHALNRPATHQPSANAHVSNRLSSGLKLLALRLVAEKPG